MRTLALAALVLGSAATAQGKVYLTLDEALELAFPECTVERTTAYLSEAETERVAELAGCDFDGAIVRPYVATREGEVVGTAYFDVHRVRSLRETVMVVVRPDGTVGRVELLAFAEPPEYVPRASWYRQFDTRRLDEDLQLKRGIRGVTGATLTARATTECVRRALAVHGVLREREAREREERERERRREAEGREGEQGSGKRSTGDPPVGGTGSR